MRKGFEVNGDYRLMDGLELVYILTNSAVMVNKVQEKEVVYGEECYFEDILSKMTLGKRHLLMARVELYKRCNSNKNQRPVIRQSTEDDRLTQSAATAAKTLNIRMLDHVIICNDSYFCYADEGRI